MGNLYNQLFGFNEKVARWVFVILNSRGRLPESDKIRLRDVFVEFDEARKTVARIHTRLGGGNREHYAEVIATMQQHPLYISDEDCPHDATYADFMFQLPSEFEPPLQLRESVYTAPPDWIERWDKVIDAISDNLKQREA